MGGGEGGVGRGSFFPSPFPFFFETERNGDSNNSLIKFCQMLPVELKEDIIIWI